MTALALAVVVSARSCWASGRFLENLHKATSRAQASERAEYYKRALDSWEPAEGAPLLAQCHFGLGQALAELWRHQQAEPHLSKALELDPLNAAAYLLRGQTRLRLAKNREAVEDLLEFVGREPANVDGLIALSEAQLKTGHRGAALRACRRAEEAAPDDPRGWLCEGRAWMVRRQWQKAERALTTASRKAPRKTFEALALRAVCRVAQNRHQQALADYSDALPHLEARLQELARRGAPKPAIEQQQQSTARAYFGRGRLREFLAQPREAAADYEAACRLGHQRACQRQPPPTGRPPKRPAIPNPASDPGERIYGG